MVNIRDRTQELFSTIDALHSRGSGGMYSNQDPLLGINNLHTPRSPGRNTSTHSEFTRRSLSINNGIDKVNQKLARLTKLMKVRGIGMDDGQGEVDDLASVIKRELAVLNSQISELQNYQKMQKAAGYTVGSNRSIEEHNTQVTVSLQSKLAEISSSFTVMLEERSHALRAQRSRREQFGAAPNISSLIPPASRQRNINQRPDSPSHVAIEMPAVTEGSSLQQLSLMTAAPDTTYLESRSNALQGIESTINELGTIYRQLATMIAEQGEQVQRIDMNIENMQVNIERGQNELAKYLRRVSSNRWLMVKIFAVLVIFVVFFNLFLI